MNTFIKTTLAVTLAIFSSTAAMGQSESANAEGIGINITKNGRIEFKELTEKKWFQDLSSRIKLHGYAQAGYTYSRHDGTNVNTFDVKRILFWVDAKITDRWSFLFMHDFSSVVQEFYTDFRITKNKALTVRFGQFKNLTLWRDEQRQVPLRAGRDERTGHQQERREQLQGHHHPLRIPACNRFEHRCHRSDRPWA